MKFTKSLDTLKKSLKYIPNATQTAGKCFNQWPLGSAPIFAKSGDGCIIKCVDNNKYIDMVSAFGPTILGYNNSRVNEAIKNQLSRGIIFSISHEIEYELAKILVDIIPSAQKVKFAKTGTDVCNAAVRIARSFVGKDGILLFNNHYHGWGDTFASVSNRSSGVIGSLSNHVVKADYNDIGAVEDLLSKGNIAAVMMEPVSLEKPYDGFLSDIRSLCDKYGSLLIFDEIITGFRWALNGAQGYYNIMPDMSLFSKSMANGMPMSVVVGREDVMQETNKVFFSGTFFGETLSIAASIATISELVHKKDLIYDHIWNMGGKVKNKFDQICLDTNVNAEMIGLSPRYNIRFSGSDPHGMNDLFKQEMIKRGILVGSQFYITWAHKNYHMDKVVSAIEESMQIIGDAVKKNDIDKRLECTERSHIIFKDNVVAKK